MTDFQKGVIEAVRKVPSGKVVSYGQIALYLDMPRAAREVGWALRTLSIDSLPWWRVVNKSGRISIKGNMYVNASNQKKLLEKEGIEVSRDFEVDMDKYGFQLGFR